MKVTQIADLLNKTFGEILGEDNLITENLSNVVESGRIITNSSTFDSNFDNYAGAIIDKVGRTIFWDRVYTADDLGFWRDSWEYGSVLEKVRCDVGDYDDNAEWDLAGQGQDYDGTGRPEYNDNLTKHIQDMYRFYPAKTQAKYFNGKTTFKAAISITRKQLREAFRSAADMGRFIAMIENRLKTKLEISKNQLQKMTLANMISEHLYGTKQVVDLEAEANATGLLGANYTAGTMSLEKALASKEITRFIAQKITWYRDMMKEPSVLYSATGKFFNHTPVEYSRTIVLSDLDSALRFNVYGDTYNEEFVKLNNYKTVPFWQSSGNNDFNVRSGININNSESHAVHENGIVGVVFDRDGVMICNEEPEVRAKYNEDGNFTNYFYNTDCSYYTDFDENAIVFVWGTKANRTVALITALTVTLAQGSATGTTKFSVSPASGDHVYVGVFDEQPTDATFGGVGGANIDAAYLTAHGFSSSAYTSGGDIQVTAGQYVGALEVDANGKAVKFGSAQATASVIK